LRSRRALPFPCPSLTPSDHSPLVPPSQFEDLWKEHLRERKDFEIRNRSGVTSTVLRQHTYISSLAASNPAPPPMVLSRHGSMPGAPPRAPNPPRQHVRAVVVPAPPMMYAQAARGGPSYRPPSSGYAHAARGQVLPRPPAPPAATPAAPPPPRAAPPPPPTHHSQPPADRHRGRISAPPSETASTAPRHDDPYAKYFDKDLKRERKIAYEREYASDNPRPPRESTPDRTARRDAFDAAFEAARRKAENRQRASVGGGAGPWSVGNQPSRQAPATRDAPPKRASEERPARGGVDVAAMLSSIGASRSAVARPMPSVPVGAAAAPRAKTDTGFEERARALAEEKRRTAEKERATEKEKAAEKGKAAEKEKAAEKGKAAERSKAAKMARGTDQPSTEGRPSAQPRRSRTVTIDDTDTDDSAGEEDSESESMGARPAVIDDDEDEAFEPAAAGKGIGQKKRGRGRPKKDDGRGGGSAKKAKGAPRRGRQMGIMPEERLRRSEAPKQLDEPMEGWSAEMPGGFVHYTRDVYCQAAARLLKDGSFGSIDRIWRRFNQDETARAFEACDPAGRPDPNKSQILLRSVKAVACWLENNYGDD